MAPVPRLSWDLYNRVASQYGSSLLPVRTIHRRSSDHLPGAAIAGIVVGVMAFLTAAIYAVCKRLAAVSKPSPPRPRSHRTRHHHHSRRHGHCHRHGNYDVYGPRERWPEARAGRPKDHRRKRQSSSKRHRPSRMRTGCGHRHERARKDHKHHRNERRRHRHYAIPDDSVSLPVPEYVGQWPGFASTGIGYPPPVVGMHKPTAAPTHHPAYTQHNRPNNRVWDEEPVVVSGQGHPTTGSEETAPAAASSGQENNPFATPPPSKSSEGRIADVPISPASAPAPANPEHETDNELPRASRVRDWVREIPGRLETMRDPATHHPFIPPKGLRSNHIIEVNRVAQTSGRSKSVATPERVPDGAPSAPVGTQTPAITINTPSSTTPNFDGQTPNTTNEPRISSRHTRSNLQPHASAQQYQYPLNTPQKYPPRSAPQTPIYVSGGPPAIPTSKISETGRHHLQQGPNYPFTNFQQAGLSRLGNNACTCGHCHQTGSLQMLGSDGYLSSGDSGTELGEVRDRGG